MTKHTERFQRDHEKRGGRKRDTANLFSFDIKKSLMTATHLVGEDLAGKDGIVGYFRWIAFKHPKVFVSVFLPRLLLGESYYVFYHPTPLSLEEI